MAIPFSQQCLPRDSVENINFDRARGQSVRGEDLLVAVEKHVGLLPAELRELFPFFSIPEVPRRGRPANDRGREDFGLAGLDERYAELLLRFQAEPRMHDEPPPSERAYRQLAAEMKDIFCNSDWRSLMNKHSVWRNGRFHRLEDMVDSEDFDAEIEQQLVAHK